jgi:hypothetical protein
LAKAEYSRLESGDTKKLKQLEGENRNLKQVVAQLSGGWTIRH